MIQAMVRPRTGDFLYTTPELDVMSEDIQIFKALGVTGVVFGVLTCGGRIDVEHTELFGCQLFWCSALTLTRFLALYRKLYQWKVRMPVT